MYDEYAKCHGMLMKTLLVFNVLYCDDFYKEKDYAHRLLEYIEAQHYIISGDYLCEVITDMPISLPDERKMFLRLQVPIEFCTKRL